jgi:hypothetical protein
MPRKQRDPMEHHPNVAPKIRKGQQWQERRTGALFTVSRVTHYLTGDVIVTLARESGGVVDGSLLVGADWIQKDFAYVAPSADGRLSVPRLRRLLTIWKRETASADRPANPEAS